MEVRLTTRRWLDNQPGICYFRVVLFTKWIIKGSSKNYKYWNESGGTGGMCKPLKPWTWWKLSITGLFINKGALNEVYVHPNPVDRLFPLFHFDSHLSGTRKLYINDNLDSFFAVNSVSAFSIAADGSLVEIAGSPFPTGGRATGIGPFAASMILVHGNRLYAFNAAGSTISVFSIHPTTGHLTLLTTPPVPIGDNNPNGVSLAITPDGRFLYFGGLDSHQIKIFALDQNGIPSPTMFNPINGGQLVGLEVSPNGKFLLAGDFSENLLQVFRIGSDGSLTLIPQLPLRLGGSGVTDIKFNCAGTRFFVGQHHFRQTTTDVVNLDQDGMLSLIPGSPFIQTSGTFIGAGGQIVLLSPDNRFLFVSNQEIATVTVWNVLPDDSLSLVEGSSFPLQSLGVGAAMATDKDGKYLYATNSSSDSHGVIAGFAVANNGVLTHLVNSPFHLERRGTGIRSLATYPARSCAAPFDLCIQDESSRDVLRINTTTGAYQITRCRDGFTMGGTGTLSKRGCTISFQDAKNDRRIMASVDTCQNKATASIQIFAQGSLVTLNDRNTANNSCNCPNSN
jgi:6-phosphogluconolactonase